MLEKKKGKVAQAMIDAVWPLENDAIQIRALVKFTGRENKTRAADNATQKESNKKAITEIRKDINWFRNMLANSLLGPRQAIHNILREHRDLRLAYRSYNPQQLVDALWQMSCTKKKFLNQLIYCRKKKMKMFVDYQTKKIKHLENLEQSSGNISSPKVGSLTNQIHQMQVRKDAANLINKMYKTARDILKRDAVFFDNVLNALKKHAEEELKFIIKITEMGQNATEHNANIEEEYAELEKSVRMNMAARGHQVRALAREVQILEENYVGLVRTEKERHWGKTVVATESELQLNQDLTALQEIMVMLEQTAHVSACNDIYKRLKAQVPQRAHMKETVSHLEHVREAMLNKRSHAQILAATLENKLLDTTAGYRQTKAALHEDIANEEEQIKIFTADLEETGNLMVTLRTSLQTLFDLMECVKPDIQQPIKSKVQPITEDAHIIMKLAKFKLRDLIELIPPDLEPNQETVETAKAMFQRTIADKIAKAEYEAEEEVEFSLDLLELDDPEVVTRSEIKQRSDKIVAEESKPSYF